MQNAKSRRETGGFFLRAERDGQASGIYNRGWAGLFGSCQLWAPFTFNFRL